MTRRTDMLSSEVRDLVAPVLRECPPECGMVSISKVEVSEDSSYATFFITALEKPELALEFMKSKEQELQRQMSKLRRRKIPLLRFRVDTQAEEAEKLERLLRKLE